MAFVTKPTFFPFGEDVLGPDDNKWQALLFQGTRPVCHVSCLIQEYLHLSTALCLALVQAISY